MSNRRQKAMEDRCKEQHSRKPKAIDYRSYANLEEVQEKIKLYRKWEDSDWIIKGILSNHYKNGAKLFDEAIALENSPLMKALS